MTEIIDEKLILYLDEIFFFFFSIKLTGGLKFLYLFQRAYPFPSCKRLLSLSILIIPIDFRIRFILPEYLHPFRFDSVKKFIFEIPELKSREKRRIEGNTKTFRKELKIEDSSEEEKKEKKGKPTLHAGDF